jgi:diaminopropionate ammonia-lyase
MTLPQSWFARDARGWTCEPPDSGAAAFHRGLPGYAATPLAETPGLAAELGVGRLFVKDESARFDLRAFKFLGASWAGFRAVAARTGYAGPAALDGLRAQLRGRETAGGGDLALVTATDGNHGRAVARTARLLGLPARVYLPRVAPDVVIDRISAEGARITVVDADYDDAVAAARSDAAGAAGAVLIQDTGWAGYEQVPSWIVDGYETMFAEMDAQLSAAGVSAVDLVSVQAGVGSLAQAAVAHYRSSALAAAARPRLLCVEPDTAACVLRSLAAGALVSVPTDVTVMNGLNCGTPSSIAWPYLRGGLDAAIAVTDDDARTAVVGLASAGIAAGPSGAAGLAGLRAALTGPGSPARRSDLGLAPSPDNRRGTPPVALCISTEGPLTVES